MATARHETLRVDSDEDVVAARQLVRLWALDLGFGLVDQTKLVTAASELARNMVDYAGGGSIQIESLDEQERRGLRLIFEDGGPGIPSIELAMQDGYSSKGSLGLGMGGSKRLVNEFDITSRVGEGTCVRITKWK